MTIRNRLKKSLPNTGKHFLLSGIALAVLSACGGTGQDDGRVSATSQQFSGQAIDGYLARATVFLDSNNNGTRDAWESFAFTDNEGYYSYNSNTDTDYCADDATEQQQQYCLSTPVDYSSVVIRVDNGYDVLTGEPFLGQMSRRVNSDASGTDGLITPITSLLTSAETPDQQQLILRSLGITSADLDVDYLDTDGSGGIDAELLNTALTIHKAVTVLSDRLTDTYTQIGDNFGTPNDATSAVYPELAEAVSVLGFDIALSEPSLHRVLDRAEGSLREVYEVRDLKLPADMGSPERPGQFTRVAEVVSDIPPVVDSLVNSENGGPTADDVAGKARALESLVIKAVNEKAAEDSSITSVVEFFTNDSNEPLIGALVESLSEDTADLSSLSRNDFSGSDFDSILEITQSASIPDGIEPFDNIGGTTLRISELDLGVAPNALDDSEIEFYFDGAPGDVEGSFNACIKVITDAKSDGTLGDANTRGELASGFWSMFGSVDGRSYSLLVTINVLGANYSGIIKAAGEEVIDGANYHAVRFDYDGNLQTWHSIEGFTAGGTAPVNDAGCEARLPSRIGI